MVLSHSRDPFTCFTTSMDLATFWDCHRRAFAHFGGVPGSIVYDRTKTVIKRHVAPRAAVPLHPEAAAFAEHYGFSIDVLAAYRPTGKGRVERQVRIVRDHVIAGPDASTRSPTSTARSRPGCRSAGARSTAPTARSSPSAPSRTGPRCEPLPDQPYLVTEKHLRRVGRDCLISFEASLLLGAGPADPARASGSRCADQPTATGRDPRPHRRRRWLARQPPRVPPRRLASTRPLGRAARRHTRATIANPSTATAHRRPAHSAGAAATLLHRRHADTPSPPDPSPTTTPSPPGADP